MDSFQYDITPHVRFDGSNVVAVHCDNSAKETSRWYTGSGIYQANERTVLNGRALLVVRAAHQAGEITVKASAGGLATSSLKLMAKPVGD